MWRHALTMIAVAVAYLVVGWLGLAMAFVHGNISPVFPATGIAVAAVLVFGYRAWPAVAVGAGVLTASTGAPALAVIGIAIGNTLEALAAAAVARRVGGMQLALDRLPRVAWFVAAVLLAPAVAASFGTASLAVTGVEPQAGTTWVDAWRVWWLGDVLGAVVVAPAVLALAAAVRWVRWADRVAEAVAVPVLLAASTALVFGPWLTDLHPHYAIASIVFPFVIWSGLRFGQVGAAGATLLVSLVATAGTAAGHGPFAGDDVVQRLTFLQFFTGVVAVTGMVVAAYATEHEQAETVLRAARDAADDQRRRAQEALAAAEEARAVAERMRFLAEMERAAANEARASAEEAFGRAEAANKAKDRFLAVLSHELRTPLAPVLTTASALEADPAVPAPLRDDLSMIRRNVELEVRLIDDLLDLTRVSRGKLGLKLATVDAYDVVAGAVALCREDAEAKGVALSAQLCRPGEAFCLGDAARLQQVFWNLVKNAIKFTPAGGSVRLVTRCGGAGAPLRAEVTDTGAGIAADVLPRIFEPFEQGGENVTRQFGGLGLGLAISKAMIEAHGGTLTATSGGPGRGATFAVEMPTVAPPPSVITGAPAAPPVQLAADQPAPRAKRILLVEDHDDTRRIMARLLRGFSYEVVQADCIAAALRACGRDEPRPDLIISDLGLPDGSGLELMRQLLNRGPIKAIALSGFGMEEDVAQSRSAGFCDHLTKPIDVRTLRAAIERAMGDEEHAPNP